MKIVRPTEVTVTFESAAEAAHWLAGYLDGRPRVFTYDTSTPQARAECQEIERAAVERIAAVCDLPVRGVTREADKEHAAPTYISGSSDRVYLISEMPTRYIRNVLNMPAERAAEGIRRVLYDELSRRNGRELA